MFGTIKNGTVWLSLEISITYCMCVYPLLIKAVVVEQYTVYVFYFQK